MAHKQKPFDPSKACTADDLHHLLNTPDLSPQFFRKFMLHKSGAARCFCRHHFSQQTKRKLYLTRMEVLHEQFIDERMQDKIGNVVLRTPSRPPKRGWSYIIILHCCEPHLLTSPVIARCLQRIYDMHTHTVADDKLPRFHLILFHTNQGDDLDPTQPKDLPRYLPLQPMGYA
ncbi:MAG: Rpn family recombination-promoting nuclease/putative transposase [Myxococcota bacterium]